MNDFSELINLIESNPSNWQSILKNKPYAYAYSLYFKT